MIRIRGAYLDVDPMLVANWHGQGNIRLGQTPEGPLHGATHRPVPQGLGHAQSGPTRATSPKNC